MENVGGGEKIGREVTKSEQGERRSGRKELTRWPHLSAERREGGKGVAGWARPKERRSAGEELGRKAEGG